MTSRTTTRCAALAAAFAALLLLSACERPPVDTVQVGYRGTGMEQVYNPRLLAQQAQLNAVPADTPLPPPGGPPASAVFKNLQVVGDLSVAEFTRLMVSITAWVSPEQGCAYCHQPGQDMSSDALYTKVVARRMLQMNRDINSTWKVHVADTGVTCYTCHRGKNVPDQVGYTSVAQRPGAMLGNKGGQNAPSLNVGLSSLPNDLFVQYLSQPSDIRVIGDTALPTGNRQSTKQAEGTYGLMMHMSQSLGVNCTYCHNSRAFGSWAGSSPQRVTAYHGIRMAQDVNARYLLPLAGTLPPNRLGPAGDVPKVSCATCHQGAYKPLYGAKMLAAHPALAGARVAAVPAAADAAASSPTDPTVPAAPAASAATATTAEAADAPVARIEVARR